MSFGAFSSDSKSNATDNRIAVTDQAQAVRGGAGKTLSNALDLSKANLGTTFKTVKLAKGASLTIGTDNSPAVADLGNKLAELAKGTTETLRNQLDKQVNLTQSALGKIGDLAGDQQTGGQSSANKTVLYLVIAALAALAFIFRK